MRAGRVEQDLVVRAADAAGQHPDQQVGRAGRALDTAQVVLIPTPADEGIWRYFATASIPRPQDAEAVLTALAESGEPLSVPRLAATTGVRDSRLELLLKVLAVDGAVERTADGAPVAPVE